MLLVGIPWNGLDRILLCWLINQRVHNYYFLMWITLYLCISTIAFLDLDSDDDSDYFSAETSDSSHKLLMKHLETVEKQRRFFVDNLMLGVQLETDDMFTEIQYKLPSPVIPVIPVHIPSPPPPPPTRTRSVEIPSLPLQPSQHLRSRSFWNIIWITTVKGYFIDYLCV